MRAASSSRATQREPEGPAAPAPAEDFSRDRVLAYLLGELPPAELAQIDARLLVDRDFHAAVSKARNDLKADYRKETLSPPERERARWALNRSGS